MRNVQFGCPYCEKIIPANSEHICANPTQSFLTAHSCHEATQPVKSAYDTAGYNERRETKHERY